ncbi:Anaphase-promoting complex [Klebsormidium nitens]|uniref:Anaphase-promoting complex n=1 Tax=Klebsormidium nitens TaxID=105231 RepID=A0A1Y1HZ42_KLENI|nr:Anaphase-promoting complex [Klebsormidium nitens]|eukprot:GAQ83915.1 Anaphase-promoting complex [Klebsormidium nitens]
MAADEMQKRAELRRAIGELSERGLVQAAKWAAEQLVGLSDADGPSTSGGVSATPSVTTRKSRKKEPSALKGCLSLEESEQTKSEEDVLLLGKVLFDSKEYRRAAHALRECTSKRGTFLRCYATYLAGEKRKEEEIVEVAGPLGKSDVINQDLESLEAELGGRYLQGQLDAFSTYLYGVVLHQREKKAEARKALAISVNAYPWNWSAWLELQELCTKLEDLPTLALEPHWMRDFFHASLALKEQKNEEGLQQYRALAAAFPRSDYVVAQTATAHYNLRQFDEAQELFEQLLKSDPYRVDGLDIYSNILYVKECFSALSYLAHKAVLTDKYRPETCCIIGNYYSLKAQHERAVLYFKRALKLNRNYLSAWTLMGHEFVEMKNTPAAIDAYRRAVDIDPKDYRAWYGLGQTYEILAMPYYALYYYRRATQLRPNDPRMWCAMGQCYENEQLGMQEAAIRCYRRAVSYEDREGIALHKLARLHQQLEQMDEAAHYFRKNLERMEQDQADGRDVVEALVFLAAYCKNQGLLHEAEQYCTKLMDYGAPEKEEAKAILREIRSVQEHGVLSPHMDLESYTP